MGLTRCKIGEVNAKGERKAKFSKRANEGKISVVKLKTICACGHDKGIQNNRTKSIKCTRCKREVKSGVVRRKG